MKNEQMTPVELVAGFKDYSDHNNVEIRVLRKGPLDVISVGFGSIITSYSNIIKLKQAMIIIEFGENNQLEFIS
jgi:hypothetical protein